MIKKNNLYVAEFSRNDGGHFSTRPKSRWWWTLIVNNRWVGDGVTLTRWGAERAVAKLIERDLAPYTQSVSIVISDCNTYDVTIEDNISEYSFDVEEGTDG